MSKTIVTFTVTPPRKKHLGHLKQQVRYVDSQITNVTYIKVAAYISKYKYKCISFKISHFFHEKIIVTYFVVLLCLKWEITVWIVSS
jgi:hypothetical protein